MGSTGRGPAWRCFRGLRGEGGTEGPDCCRPVPQPRLKCLIHVVKKLSAEHEEFISALVPEVRGVGRWGACVNVAPEGRFGSGGGRGV